MITLVGLMGCSRNMTQNFRRERHVRPLIETRDDKTVVSKWVTCNSGSLLRPVTTSSPTDRSKKGKAIPLKAWTGPDGSRRFRLAELKTVGKRSW